jgi:carbon-monoxide dehydrogenase large subunit
MKFMDSGKLNDSWIGSSPPRLNGLAFTQGFVRYSADLIPHGALHVALVRSPHRCARIVSVDTAAALTLKGVVAVVDGKQAATLAQAAPPAFPFPAAYADREILGHCLPFDIARYVGEAVVAVVAETVQQAEAAAELVSVSYEVLPSVGSADEAVATFAPVVHPGWGTNVLAEDRVFAGNVDAALATADHIITGEVSVSPSTAAPMEPLCYIGAWDEQLHRLTVTGTFQNPHASRWQIVTALKLDETDVRVIAPAMGGGFGFKMAGHPEEVLVAVLSRLTGRPVAYVENRRDTLRGHCREQTHRFEIAAMNDGQIVAFRDVYTADIGTVGPCNGWTMPLVTATVFPTVYDIPHVEVVGTLVATNKAPWRPVRGYGKEIANLVMERAVSMLADSLGLDPIVVRQRNLLPSTALPRRLPSGLNVDSGDYPAILNELKTLFGYDAWCRRRDASRTSEMRIGIGIGFELTPEGGARPGAFPSGFETASIRMSPTGQVELSVGVTSPGSGNETGLAQIVASVLGLRPEQIRVKQGDTDTVPVGTGNASSRAILYGGPAAHLAALDLRAKIAICAGNLLQAKAADIAFHDGRAIGPSGQSVTLAEIAFGVHTNPFRVAQGMNLPLEATRSYQPSNVRVAPDLNGRIATYSSFPYSAHAVAVELDTGTGHVSVLDIAAFHDCGVMINPALVTGQLKGAIAMGVGTALWEELTYKPGGELQSDRFKTYLLPRSTDLPPIRIGHMSIPSPFNPLGLKGAGESGVAGALAATINAVADALGPVAGKVTAVPATPPRLMERLFPEDSP